MSGHKLQPNDTIADRVRDLMRSLQDNESLSVAATVIPEAVNWLVDQPRISQESASTVATAARDVRRSLGGFFPGDMLDSAHHRHSFLAGAVWVLIEVTEAIINCVARAEQRREVAPRSAQVLDAVRARVLMGRPVGAKEILTDPSLDYLQLRADEVSRAFAALLSEGMILPVETKDRRRRLFELAVDTAAPRVHTTLPGAQIWKEDADFIQWEAEFDHPLNVQRELVRAIRGTAAQTPELRIDDAAFFEAVVGRARRDNESAPYVCFTCDERDASMVVDLYVSDALDSLKAVLITLKSDRGDVSVPMIRGTSAADGVTEGFTGRVRVDEWPVFARVVIGAFKRQ